MRLILAAIFCSALLSDLLNMKRFALQGDRERQSCRGSSPHPLALPLYDPGGAGWGALFHSSTRVPGSCVQVSDTVTGIATVS